MKCQSHLLLLANDCPRVVAGYVHELALQMEQDCPPLRQPLRDILQLLLDALVGFVVVIIAAQPAPQILHSTSQHLKSAGGATKQIGCSRRQNSKPCRVGWGCLQGTLCGACLRQLQHRTGMETRGNKTCVISRLNAAAVKRTTLSFSVAWQYLMFYTALAASAKASMVQTTAGMAQKTTHILEFCPGVAERL